MLPLDLHVLGLPLAFILSQDQTLRCKNFEFFVVLSQGILLTYAVFPFFLNLSKNLFCDLSVYPKDIACNVATIIIT